MLHLLWQRIKALPLSMLHIAAPSVCFVCGRELTSAEKDICTSCLKHLPRTYYEREHDNICEQKFWGKVRLQSAFGIYHYRKKEQLQRIVHQFKYHGNSSICITMGEEMGRILLSQNIHKQYDALVPVPLHPKRQRMRGYNQAELLAQGISNVTGMPVKNNILKRTIYTNTQTKKNKYERYENIHEAFALNCNPQQLIGLRLLLIDDVLTSGNTAEACTSLIAQIPYTHVGVATLGNATN